MKHVAEHIDIRVMDGLLPEHVVTHELDPGFHVGGDAGFGAMDHFGEVLHDEVEIGRGLGDLDADGAPGAADVDDGSLPFARGTTADGRPGVAVHEEGGESPHHIRGGGHASRETLGHFRVGSVMRPDGLIGILGKTPAGMLGLVGAPFLAGLECPRRGLEELVVEIADPRAGHGIVDKDPRGGRVADEVWARFAEDVVIGHCEAETAPEVDEVEAAFGGEVCEGDFAMNGHFRRDVVFVDGLEADGVQLEGLSVEPGEWTRALYVWSNGE